MLPEIYWIRDFLTGHLAIMPRPRADDWDDWLEDEMRGLRQEGVNILVCLLTIDEIHDLGLSEERRFCQHNDIEFISFPIADRTVPPSFVKTRQLSQTLLVQIEAGKKIAVHCRAGIGRSGLIAASILVCAGISPTQAYAMVSKARGLQVPDTAEQELWLIQFAQYSD